MTCSLRTCTMALKDYLDLKATFDAEKTEAARKEADRLKRIETEYLTGPTDILQEFAYGSCFTLQQAVRVF